MNIAILKRNPELARNVELELTKQRLIVMPVILMLLSFLVLSTSHINSYLAQNQYYYLARYSSVAFVIIAVLWGAKNAADGVLDEYNSRTWDWQRMSTLSPWKMTIGKLFGSTIFNWYGGVICLLINMVSTLSSDAQEVSVNWRGVSEHENLILYFVQLLCYILMAISIQGIVILFSLTQMKKGDGRRKIKGNLIIIFPVFFILVGFGISSVLHWSGFNYWGKAVQYWYGIDFGYFRELFSTLFYTCWIVAGLYRTMRTELQYTNGLKWWILFLISSAVFNAGYFIGQDFNISLNIILAIVFTFIFFGYTTIAFLLTLIEPKEIVNFRIVLKYYREKNYQQLYNVVPLWTVTIIFVILSGIIASCFLCTITDTSIDSNIHRLLSFNFVYEELQGLTMTITTVPYAVIAFLIRDIAIILYVNLMRKHKSADATAILYLAILHFVIPLIIRDSGIGFLFYPYSNAGIFLMLAAPIGEAAVMIYFLVRKWKEINSRIAA